MRGRSDNGGREAEGRRRRMVERSDRADWSVFSVVRVVAGGNWRVKRKVGSSNNGRKYLHPRSEPT